jgi:hypothetical protein
LREIYGGGDIPETRTRATKAMEVREIILEGVEVDPDE